MAAKQVRVVVQQPKDRKHLVFRWTDPETGQRRCQSAQTADPHIAEMRRKKLEDDLNAGRWKPRRRGRVQEIVHSLSLECEEAGLDEQQWQACEQSQLLLNHLLPTISRRKAALYLCAGLRCCWDLLADEEARQGVNAAEKVTEQLSPKTRKDKGRHSRSGIDFGSLTSVRITLQGDAQDLQASWGINLNEEEVQARMALATRLFMHAFEEGQDSELAWSIPWHYAAREEWPKGWLVREIFANPFRRLSLPGELRTALVLSLAQRAYDERELPSGTLNSDRLKVLADALEEAGCDSEEILDHLRGPGPHYLGCWALDKVLARE